MKAIKKNRIAAYRRWWKGIADKFKPPSADPVNIWAHNNLQFNEPGNTGFFEIKGREYIIEPVDSAKDWRVRDVVLVFGSQSGKTSGLMAMVGWSVSNRNVRILWVMTGQEMADKFADTR